MTRARLSISNSSRLKANFKRAISTGCFLLGFVLIGQLLKYVLVNDTRSYTRLMMHQMQFPEENIEVLFVGSSHVYRSFIPSITDDSFGAYTFNAGSSSQYMDGSLAVIQEALRYNDVKKIYLEMYFGVAEGGTYTERTQMTSTYAISDYMSPSFDRVKYLLAASSKDHYSNSFLIIKRNWERILDIPYIISVVKAKRSDAYRNYYWDIKEDDTEIYVDRGFVANDSVVNEFDYWNAAAYRPINVSALLSESDYLNSLSEIIAVCEHKNIELTLFIAPMPEWTLVGKGNYDEYSTLIKNIAIDNDLRFYDFNFCKEAFFDTNEMAFFKDTDHLNTNGAKVFSKLFGDFFMGRIPADTLFYDSLEDKIAEQDTRVYGIAGPVQESENNRGRIIANRRSGVLYKITTIDENGQESVLQDYSDSIDFVLPHGTNGTIRIEWKNEQEEAVGTIEAAY